MNFFEAQDRARRTTRWLMLGYVFTVSVVVVLASCVLIAAFVYIVPAIELLFTYPWIDSIFSSSSNYYRRPESPYTPYDAFVREHPEVIFGVAAAAVAIGIHIATESRKTALAYGGSVVASAVGATRLPAPAVERADRRLRYVVEEMAIASSVPVPDIYVLEKEGGINAFAAGTTPQNAAIVVTHGALEKLNRNELQGLVAHEFSHISNGDMALNVRAMSLLFGMSAVSMVGRWIAIGGKKVAAISGIVWSLIMSPAALADKHVSEKFAKILAVPLFIISAPIMLFALIGIAIIIAGLVAIVTGAFGRLSASITRSAISRQREYLADASAIQFTRHPTALIDALKKIRNHRELSYIKAVDPAEISHMLFASGSKFSWTHPPLRKRIGELESSFDEADYPRPKAPPEPVIAIEEQNAEIVSSPASGIDEGILPEAITETVGQPGPEHVEYARQLRQSIPGNLYDAAHSLEMAYPLTLALILDRSGEHIDRQMALIEDCFSAERYRLVEGFRKDLASIGVEYRLPLLELVMPALKRRPDSQLVELLEFADRLAKIDDRIDLYEYCIGRILRLYLRHVLDPSAKRRLYSRSVRRGALANVLIAVAQRGHESPTDGQAALDAARQILGKWTDRAKMDVNECITLDTLDQSLDLLATYAGKDFSKLLLAICTAAAHDGRLTIAEAELIRVVAATLDCPVPPILGEHSAEYPAEPQ